MEKWYFAVYTNCLDASREKEFNEWYDNIHLPDVFEVPGFVRASRYENREPIEGQGKFLTWYEVETEDIDQTLAALKETMDKKREQGRYTDLVDVVSRVLYKQLTDTTESKK